jgi:predicted AAA+ superfamily ATPase
MDKSLKKRLRSFGAVLIEGTKGCGKTETAKQAAESVARLDVDENIRIQMEIDPSNILQGATPRLIDEWPEYPQIWNYIRHEVDERQKKGQFILTGSATPNDKFRRHSGAGRFSILTMRPMSLFERGWSTGEVSLTELMRGLPPCSENVDFDLGELAEKISLGGWPGLIRERNVSGRQFAKDYISLIAEVDLNRVSEKRRDPNKIKRLLQSLARNISTEATITSLTKDVRGYTGSFNDETAAQYLENLERLKVYEKLPAWNIQIRSAASLRKSPKHHFVDPSLAVGALDLSVDKLLADLKYLGLLFKSLAIRDLRILSESIGGDVFHYRDSTGLEVDAIIECGDGTWGAFEIKLGMGSVPEAAKNLLKLADKVKSDHPKNPATLTVITGNGFAHSRKDGVNVAPLSTLTE